MERTDMNLTRRTFLKTSACMAAALSLQRAETARARTNIRLSACDWSMQMTAQPEALGAAQALGLEGVEIAASTGVPDDGLPVAEAETRAAYKEAMERTGVTVSGVALTFHNNTPFARDPRAPEWLASCIDAAEDLGAGVILIPFFFAGDLRDEGGELLADDVDATLERLRDAAPAAEEAGVVLGIENWLSAEENLDIVERIGSDMVRVYYDIGNSTVQGYDVPAEIRLLADQLAPSIHFKDGGGALGDGEVDMEGVAEALEDIAYQGWVTLETAVLDRDRDGSFERNAAFARELLGLG